VNQQIRMLGQQELLERLSRCRTSLWSDTKKGLVTSPVRMGARSHRWPESEVDAIVRARIAGQTDDEIRALVVQLEAERAIPPLSRSHA
jgi:prophage regulatory protein